MDLSRIREDLGQYLQRNQDGRDNLVRLLEALEKKDAELQRRLKSEKEPLKRRRLEIEIKVIRLQHSKGVELREARA